MPYAGFGAALRGALGGCAVRSAHSALERRRGAEPGHPPRHGHVAGTPRELDDARLPPRGEKGAEADQRHSLAATQGSHDGREHRAEGAVRAGLRPAGRLGHAGDEGRALDPHGYMPRAARASSITASVMVGNPRASA